MRPISLRLILILSLIVALPCAGQERGATENEVLRDFEQILDLWRDGRYAELYERTDMGGKQSKETFARKLASAPRHPACCWEKIQDAHVSVQKGRSAVVRARLGFEGAAPGVEYVTKGVKLKKEGGLWVIPQSELFSLANLAKRGTKYRYLQVQER